MSQRAERGSIVRVHYTGRLRDGSIFDSSEGGEPLEFVIGAGMVIPGFERAVIGMQVGEKKTVEIPPEEAYGTYIEEFVKEVPRSELHVDFELVEGMTLELHTESGRVIPITVAKLTEETVTLDANHPLAGQTLIFDIELVSIA
ncbi:FKBP-type peptidyl-prolyl cis-trans isomerase SlyD [bacterium HR08]|nr:FKBP-type peptidyl-prolyl cis-trans isomerase SlyD [bacterium HR08]